MDDIPSLVRLQDQAIWEMSVNNEKLETGRWEVDEQTVPFSVQVAGKVMAAMKQRITRGD